MVNVAVRDIHVIWMTTGARCGGDSAVMSGALNSRLPDIAPELLPGIPDVYMHHPVISCEIGNELISWWYKAEREELDQWLDEIRSLDSQKLWKS